MELKLSIFPAYLIEILLSLVDEKQNPALHASLIMSCPLLVWLTNLGGKYQVYFTYEL